ncbi:hypothetical protein ACFFRR_001633 [Megaselia abdita]
MFSKKSVLSVFSLFILVMVVPTPSHGNNCNAKAFRNMDFSRQISTNDDIIPGEFLNKREAQPHSAPYIVSLQQITPTGERVHFCAGTIINEHWILTAAHCLPSREIVQNSIIVAGCHELYQCNKNSCQRRTIDNYVVHNLYTGGIAPYDIALIYTKKPFTWTRSVQKVNMPEEDSIPTGRGVLFGWGNISTTRVPWFPTRLQRENMPIIELELCEKVLGPMGYSLHHTNLCTGPLTGGKSICNSDSGGPLIQDDIIVGIVSWGKMPCGQVNAPSVYVRVSAFVDWIKEQTSGCCESS